MKYSLRARADIGHIEGTPWPAAIAWRAILSPTVWVMGAALVAASFLRLWGLGLTGFNTDEAVYAGQAASILGIPEFTPLFPVFRAHPLLFHLNMAAVFAVVGVDDVAARALATLYGVGTVVVTWAAARELYGQRVAVVAALLLTVMPYHVIVTRQVMLDAPMTLFTTLSLFCLARFANGQRPVWLVNAAGALGLAVLSKEPAIILSAAVYVFIASRSWPTLRVRNLVTSAAVLVVLTLSFPLAFALAGEQSTGQSYLTWQLLRRANHEWFFYFREVPPALGIPVLVACVVALPVLRSRLGWREVLLAAWFAVPVTFFTLWPVKGYAYLLPIAPVAAIFGAYSLEALRHTALGWFRSRPRVVAATYTGLVGGIVGLLAYSSWVNIQPAPSGVFLAGSGGLVGGRETAEWIKTNVPTGARLMTIGPSFANVIMFYGHREARGLSVSPNPLHRNPSYEPLQNPDFMTRRSDIHYVVWDAYSASRSPFFSERLLAYAERYHGREVYRFRVAVSDSADAEKITIAIVYEVRP